MRNVAVLHYFLIKQKAFQFSAQEKGIDSGIGFQASSWNLFLKSARISHWAPDVDSTSQKRRMPSGLGFMLFYTHGYQIITLQPDNNIYLAVCLQPRQNRTIVFLCQSCRIEHEHGDLNFMHGLMLLDG